MENYYALLYEDYEFKIAESSSGEELITSILPFCMNLLTFSVELG